MDNPVKKKVSKAPPTIRPLMGSKASYPAVPITQNAHRFYFTTIPVTDLFPYCFVARRDEEPKLGFQRNLSEERAKDIARYLDSSQGSIPTNIVLSAQDEASLEYDRANKTISYRRVKRGFLVLDGQHRLYGYSMTTRAHRVPVAIYENLTRKDEAALFIDINTNQRGVPAALLLDIKHVAEKETADESQMREWFDKLDGDPKSSLAGLLSKSKSTPGRISRVTFNRGVRQILKNAIMIRLPSEKQYELLRNYFGAVEQSLQDTTLLRRSAYFEAFCDIFDDVMRLSRANHQTYKPEALAEVLGAIKNIDLSSVPTHGKTYVTKSAITPIIKSALAGQVDVTEDMV